MTDHESCENCRFWYASWKFKKEQHYEREGTQLDITNPRDTSSLRKRSNKGLCRRYAPQASALTTVWMETKVSDWCGDFKPIAQPQ